MSTTIVGVDPGKTGAIVVMERSRLALHPMPVITSKKRAQYDLREVYEILNGARAGVAHWHCFIEKQQPLPPKMGGASANFFRGYSLALFEALCLALGMPYTIVSPRSWQGVMLVDVVGDDTKQRAQIAADRLFPNVDLRRSSKSRKPDLGLVDALLIAEYGRRSLASQS